MTKQAGSPPEGTSDTEHVERSGPMWESTVRLVGDDEAAHRALTQLKKAIRSRVTETELPGRGQPASARESDHVNGNRAARAAGSGLRRHRPAAQAAVTA